MCWRFMSKVLLICDQWLSELSSGGAEFTFYEERITSFQLSFFTAADKGASHAQLPKLEVV